MWGSGNTFGCPIRCFPSCPPTSSATPDTARFARFALIGMLALLQCRAPTVRLPAVAQLDGTPRARVHMAEVTREQILKDLAEYEEIKAEDLLAELRVVQA